MKAEQNYEPRVSTNVGHFSEDDEGGLDLGQILAILRRRAFLIVGIASGVAVLAGLKALNDPPVYTSQFEILIEPTTVETQVISSTNTDTVDNSQEVVDLKDEAVLKILKGSEVLNPIVQDLQPQFPEISYRDLFKGLDINTIGKNLQVVTVTYQNPNKELVESVLEKVSQAYLDYSQALRQSGVLRGIKFVDAQIPQIQSRVKDRELQLQKIRQQNNLVDPEMKGKELSTLLGTFGKQQLETQIQLQEAKALYASLQQELTQQGPESATAPALNENTRYQTLLGQLLEIDTQIAKDSVLLFEEGPEIEILKNQRQNLLPLVRQEGQRVAREIASQIKVLETRDKILSDTIDLLNREIKQLSGILRDYTEVQKQLEISNGNLNEFLAKREALRIEAAQTESPWRLLTPPAKPYPSSASLKQNLVLGTILGTLLGIGIAIALDKFSNRLYTVKEIKEVAKLPVMGVIPFEKDLAKSTIKEDEPDLTIDPVNYHPGSSNGHNPNLSVVSGFFEAFRSLYTNLRFLSGKSSMHSVVISSAGPGEGKSTVAIYLAQAAATLGQRVLLVDADLRYPGLHERLKLAKSPGLTDLISLEALDLNRTIQRSPLEDNLFVLTAGSSSLEGPKILASQKMENLMKELQTTFDLVIYKAPSLLGLADAYLLATHTDGVLLVASVEKLKRSILEQALDELKLSRTQILGIVTNCVKERPTSNLVKGKT